MDEGKPTPEKEGNRNQESNYETPRKMLEMGWLLFNYVAFLIYEFCRICE
jgi:hypothetical protein